MMDFYTNIEKTDMVFLYGYCDGNAAGAVREWRARFPQRRGPDRRTIERACNNLRQFGRFEGNHHDAGRVNGGNRPDGRPRQDLEEQILNIVADDPETSTRVVAMQLDCSKDKVHRTLREDGQHPFHFRKVQELLGKWKFEFISCCT